MLELHLLGRYACSDSSGRPVASVLAQPRTAALLAYLACARSGEYLRRGTLLPLFWPEQDEHSARHALSQAIYRLRQVLGREAIETRGDDELRITTVNRWTDVVAFEEAVSDCRFADALGVYRGELLPALAAPGADGFTRWLEAERERLRRLAASAAWAATDEALGREDAEAAETAARRALDIDPVNESAGRRVIAGLAAAGSAASAMRVYEALCLRLAEAYEISAAPETQALARAIVLERPLGRPLERPATRGGRAPEDRKARSTPAEGEPIVLRSTPARLSRRLALVSLVLVPLGALLPLYLFFAPVALPSVVIAPFIDHTGDPRRAHVADGLHHALAGELAQSARLRVLPSAAAFAADADGATSAPDYTVEAAVHRVEDTILVQLRIARTGPTELIWAGSAQRATDELDLLGRDLTSVVVRELEVRLTARGERRLSRRDRVDPEAFDAWLRALALEPRRQRDALLACIVETGRAIALAPGFAEAHRLRARCFNVLAFVDTVPPAAAFGEAKVAAQRAIDLDPGLALAYAEHAYAVAHHDWDWAAAERGYRHALRLDASHPYVHGDLAWLLAWQRRFDEALTHARRAEELAPGDVQSLLRTGMILHLAGRQEEAAQLALRAIAADSTSLFAWDRLHWAYHAAANFEGAVLAAERASALGGPGDARRRGFLANAYARAGRTAEAQAILAELLALDQHAAVPPIAIAAVYVGLGQIEPALDRLEQGYRERDGGMVLIATFPLWQDLYSHSRFRSLVAAMRLPAPPS